MIFFSMGYKEEYSKVQSAGRKALLCRAKSSVILDFGEAGNYMFHDCQISYHALGSNSAGS